MIIEEKISPVGDGTYEMVKETKWVTAFHDSLNFGSLGPRRYTTTKLYIRKR